MEGTGAESTDDTGIPTTLGDESPLFSTAALIADISGALLGAVTQIDRLHARQSAWKAEFIDQARRIALMTEDAVVTVGTNFSPAQRHDLARRGPDTPPLIEADPPPF
ncbi:hypothetical protein IWX78_001751 [Mycetocola sp. CAN_C7]|uniref:hypothetical protein n=1 Tax=Mycetocola sp. CAN_C7 TaxID=2787724 RepID=UPI0018C98B66